MSLLYLAYVCAFLFLICPILDIPTHTTVVQAFAFAHGLFTLWVILCRKNAPPVWAVDLAITLFAVQILGLAGYLGIVIFPTEASFLFPLCLVLMTQIYTRRPIFPLLEVLIPSAAYLICSFLTKSMYIFILDAIGIAIAIGITGSALFTSTSYKLRAYRAQISLQKMCALDPMTGVNNKPTFEFLAEQFLLKNPKTAHALAVCDFDDFKSINDNYGHHTGDEVLQAFAAQLHLLTDNDDDLMAGRFGGDEFVLLVKKYDSQQTVIDKLRTLSEVHGFDFPVTCSIGIAFSDSGKADFRQYFEAADQSLYRAKTEKSGKVCSANADSID